MKARSFGAWAARRGK